MWAALCDGRSGIAAIASVDVSGLRFQNGAEVKGLDPADHFDPGRLDLLDRFAQFAAVAAREAVRGSGMEFPSEIQERTAIVMGCSGGGKSTEDEGFHHLYGLKEPRVSPLTIARAMSNAGASRISFEYGITGPSFTISTACSSANHAIGQAFRMVRTGEVEAAIAGGSEAPLSLGFLKAWEAMRVVSPDTCRPFSKDRNGLILGEGAAILILEPLERARARGARIWGDRPGSACPPTRTTSRSLRRWAQRAPCERARRRGLEPEAIGYVNAHGTGTLANDATETRRSARYLAHAGTAGEFDKVDARPRSRRGGSSGGCGDTWRSDRHYSADGEFHRNRSGLRSRRGAPTRCGRENGWSALEFLRLWRTERGARIPRRAARRELGRRCPARSSDQENPNFRGSRNV